MSKWKPKKKNFITILREKFPVRQIYFRTNGVVRFISIPSWFQITMLTALAGAFGWVAVTSFHYVRRDVILEEKDRTIQTMVEEVSEVTDDMASLQATILLRAQQLEERQLYLQNVIGVKPEDIQARQAISGGTDMITPQTDVGRINTEDREALVVPAEEFREEILGRFASVEDEQILAAETVLRNIHQTTETINEAIKRTGLNTEQLVANWTGQSAMGGPYIPAPDIFNDVEEEDVAGDPFLEVAASINESWEHMNISLEILKSLPIGDPADSYYISSGFGPRTDPIRKTAAVHYALDMAGWPGTNIRATAPGVVTHASNRYAYGNMVEIDHGNGFKTRFGHLRKINVTKGQIVTRNQIIGEMGCTGRCTSSHLHYETWFGGRPRDPKPFIEVAESVLQVEREANEQFKQ